VPTLNHPIPSPGAGGNGYVVMARQGSGMQQPGMNGGYQNAPQQQQQQQQQPYVYNGEPMYVQPGMGRQPSGGHGYPAETGPQQHAVYK
jgi:hypothetical protein